MTGSNPCPDLLSQHPFHTRWSGLNESDFTSLEMGRHYEMKGYSLLRNRCNIEGYCLFEAGHEDGESEMLPLMEE